MIQLFINNKHVDITESVGLYLNKKFESIENPTLYHSEFSKTITLPMTPNNKLIFDNYNRQDSLVTNVTIDPRYKVPFYLLYNGELVMRGYAKLNNANTIYEDNKFEVELYGSFGMLMNELSQVTFNKYETESYGGVKDDKYLIESPFQNFVVDCNLVKASFEQEQHNLNGNDILDYIKIIPNYQGKYADFESNMEQWHPYGLETELADEYDEHYMREFRSYYQQPAVWVDKLWKMMKDKVEEITDYTMVLDQSWFNSNNPYWTKLIYTCPNLYSKDDNFAEYTTVFNKDSLNYHHNIQVMGSLSEHHAKRLDFMPEGTMYRTGVCNPDLLGYSRFTMTSSILLLACEDDIYYNTLARIRKNNPLFVTFYAKRADDNTVIRKKTFMLYSNNYAQNAGYVFDEKIDVGITESDHPNVYLGYPTGYSQSNGWWWEAPVNIDFIINENVRYYIQMDAKFANNGKPTQYREQGFVFWTNWFQTSNIAGHSGVHIFNSVHQAECKTLDYVRSRSKIDMYRVFPKDTTLLDVILNYSKQFGLMWDIDDDNKVITVMCRNKYFSNYRILDWTKKVDRSHDFVLEPINFNKRYVTFNVEVGEGTRYKGYNDKYGFGYGSKKIDTEYQFNSDNDDLFKKIQPSMVCSKSQSSRLYNTTDPNGDNFMGYNFKVSTHEHYVENDDDGENAGNSGAFYFCNGTFPVDPSLGFRSTDGYGAVLVTDDTEHMVEKDTYMWNLSFENFTYAYKLPDISTIDSSGKYSIHFESPKEYYYKTDTSQTQYMYEMFWKRFIDERYSVQNKKLTGYFYLTPSEYNEIKFKDFVKIQNTIYHINKVVDYDFDTNSPTKVELVQVWDIKAYTEGQKAFPALSVYPTTIEVNNQEYRPVSVYSTVSWYIESKPTWLNTQIDGNWINCKASSDPLRSRTGTVVLKSNQNPLLSASFIVTQRPLNTFINLSKYSITSDAYGQCFTVEIDSRPTDVTVQSKPEWVRVDLVPRDYVTELVEHEPAVRNDLIIDVRNHTLPSSSTTRGSIVGWNVNRLGVGSANITVEPNLRPTIRRGTIVFSNGNLTKSLTVTQLGRKIIAEQFDYEAIHIDANQPFTYVTRSFKEIVPEETDISSLGTINAIPTTKVDGIQVTFTPQLDTTDHGDGTIEVSSGGQLNILTKDGQWITKNYNFGQTVHTYTVEVEHRDGGEIYVDGVLYPNGFFEDVEEGTTLTVECVPNSDHSFVKWSDENIDNPRTMTITGDVHIYPILQDESGIAYDDEETVAFDDGEIALWDNN